MREWVLVKRSLQFYWALGILLALGVALATMAIVGSLLVGHSMKVSLTRQLTQKWGKIEQAWLAPYFLRSSLAKEMRQQPGVSHAAAIIFQNATAQKLNAKATAPQVQILGVEEDFWQFFSRNTSLSEREALISQSLADDLELQPGDYFSLRTLSKQESSQQTIFAQRAPEQTLTQLRLQVKQVLPMHGASLFSFANHSTVVRNVFVSRSWLAKQMGRSDLANVLLAKGASQVNWQQVLDQVSQWRDLGILPQRSNSRLFLHHPHLVFSPSQVQAIKQAAVKLNSSCFASSVYLANEISASQHQGFFYSLVAASERLDQQISSGELWLQPWSYQDLSVSPGTSVTLKYFVPSRGGEYQVQTGHYTYHQKINTNSPLLHPHYLPQLKGITNTDNISDWELPFPIKWDKITDRDEQYWEKYRTTPKAWLAMSDLQKLWQAEQGSAQGSGWITCLEFPQLSNDLSLKLLETLKQHSSPATWGITRKAVQQEALKASQSPTDFAMLFLSMSMFIVFSAGLLLVTLMRLNVAKRVAELGVMQALGISAGGCKRVLLKEALFWIVVGTLLGNLLGCAYGQGTIWAMKNWWQQSMSQLQLQFFFSSWSLLLGSGAGVSVGILSVLWAVKNFSQLPMLATLKGETHQPDWTQQQQLAKLKWLFLIFVALALGTLGLTFFGFPHIAAFFVAAILLLFATILGCRLILRLSLKQKFARLSWFRLAIKNLASQENRSILIITLFACVSLIIMTVAANHIRFGSQEFSSLLTAADLDLRMQSSLPIYYDLNSPEGREQLGFTPEENSQLRRTHFYPFWLREGDDVSCLNLAQPQQPRILGVPKEFRKLQAWQLQTKAEFSAGANPWKILQQPLPERTIPAVADANSLRWILKKKIGESIEISVGGGQSFRLKFVGVLHQSIFASEVLISAENFQKIFPTEPAPRYFLVSVQKQPSEVKEVLQSALVRMGVQIDPLHQILNQFLQVQNTYLNTFLILGGLGAFLGTFGLAIVIWRNYIERRKEFALLQALGHRQTCLRQLLAKEIFILLSLGIVAGAVSSLLAIFPQMTSEYHQINWHLGLAVLASIFVSALLFSWGASRLTIGKDVIQNLRRE